MLLLVLLYVTSKPRGGYRGGAWGAQAPPLQPTTYRLLWTLLALAPPPSSLKTSIWHTFSYKIWLINLSVGIKTRVSLTSPRFLVCCLDSRQLSGCGFAKRGVAKNFARASRAIIKSSTPLIGGSGSAPDSDRDLYCKWTQGWKTCTITLVDGAINPSTQLMNIVISSRSNFTDNIIFLDYSINTFMLWSYTMHDYY